MGLTDNFDNLTGLPDLYGAVHAASGGILSPLLLVLTFVISFIGMKRYSTSVAFLASSTLTSVVAILLWGTGYLDGAVVVIPLIMLCVSAIMHLSTR